MGKRRLRYCYHCIEFVDVHVAITVSVSPDKNGLEPNFYIGLLANKMTSYELKKIWDTQNEI
jgi:hypothetical protein